MDEADSSAARASRAALLSLRPKPGAKRFQGIAHAVGERSVRLRRWIVRSAGGIGSANADMSSVKQGEKPCRRKRKVSYATFIGVG